VTQTSHVKSYDGQPPIFTRYSTAALNTKFFIHRANQALILSTGVVPSACVTLHYMPDVQLFLQTELATDREDTTLFTKKSSS
jgi:hypothetical protein